MADNNNNANKSRRTYSNLPILFANGYPIPLEKMTSDQLELFIPFLVKCSRNGEESTIAPEWWPEFVEYKMPLEEPKSYVKVS